MAHMEVGVHTPTAEYEAQAPTLEVLEARLIGARIAQARAEERRLTSLTDKKSEIDDLTWIAYEEARSAYGAQLLEAEITQAETDEQKNLLALTYLMQEQQALQAEIENPTARTKLEKLKNFGRVAVRGFGRWLSTGSKKVQFAKSMVVSAGASVAFGVLGGGVAAAGGMAAVRYAKAYASGMAMDVTGQVSTQEELAEQVKDQNYTNIQTTFDYIGGIMNQERDATIYSHQERNRRAHVRGLGALVVGAVVGTTIGTVVHEAFDPFGTVMAHAETPTAHDAVNFVSYTHDLDGTVSAGHVAPETIQLNDIVHETTSQINAAHDTTSDVQAPLSVNHETAGSIGGVDDNVTHDTSGIGGLHESSGTVLAKVDGGTHEAPGTIGAAHETSGNLTIIHEAGGANIPASTPDGGHESAGILNSAHETTGTVYGIHEVSSDISENVHESSGDIAGVHEVPQPISPEISKTFTVEKSHGYVDELMDAAKANGKEMTPEQAWNAHKVIVDKVGADYLNLINHHGHNTYSMENSPYEVGISAPGEATWAPEAQPLIQDAIDDGVINGSVHEVGSTAVNTVIEHAGGPPSVSSGEGINAFVADHYNYHLTNAQSIELGHALHDTGYAYQSGHLQQAYSNPYGISASGPIDSGMDTIINDMVGNGHLDVDYHFSQHDWGQIENMLEKAASHDNLADIASHNHMLMDNIGSVLNGVKYADGQAVVSFDSVHGHWLFNDSKELLPQRALELIYRYLNEHGEASEKMLELTRVV